MFQMEILLFSTCFATSRTLVKCNTYMQLIHIDKTFIDNNSSSKLFYEFASDITCYLSPLCLVACRALKPFGFVY